MKSNDIKIKQHVRPFHALVSFYTSRKYQKNKGFLILSVGVERDQAYEMNEGASFESSS